MLSCHLKSLNAGLKSLAKSGVVGLIDVHEAKRHGKDGGVKGLHAIDRIFMACEEAGSKAETAAVGFQYALRLHGKDREADAHKRSSAKEAGNEVLNDFGLQALLFFVDE